MRGCGGDCQVALMNQGRQNAPSSGAGCVNTSSVCLGSTYVPLTLAEQGTGGCTLCVFTADYCSVLWLPDTPAMHGL